MNQGRVQGAKFWQLTATFALLLVAVVLLRGLIVSAFSYLHWQAQLIYNSNLAVETAKLVAKGKVHLYSLIVGFFMLGGISVFLFNRLVIAPMRQFLRAKPPDENRAMDALRSFDEFARRLRLTQEEMREWNEELERRVAERTRQLQEAHAELRAAWDKLAAAERLALLGQMAAGVAHEIRNPLGVIAASTFYLKDSLAEGSEDQIAQLNVIEREVQRMEKTLEDLLVFARVSSSYNEQEVNVGELIKDTLEVATFEGLLEGVELEVEIGELPRVKIDPDQFRRLFLNLIRNAVEAMAESKKRLLTVKAFVRGGELVISFEDTGCGIKAEHMGRIFEPFFTTKVVGKGTGLGLAICKSIVERVGGRIEVESREGEGAKFSVVLPLGSE